jgi:hypothetical protein
MRSQYKRRAWEWCLLAKVILVLFGYFLREFRTVQAQGEAAAVKSTLGSLRTALLLDFLQREANHTAASVAVQRNPFLLLDNVPENYAGLLDSAKGKTLQGGTWVFDTYCVCIGYEPLNTQGLSVEETASTLWFRVGAPPGPLQINAMQAYRWAGLPVD